MQQDASTESMLSTDVLKVVNLSDDFVRLLGVDRRTAESLEPVFAARCDQLVPVDAESEQHGGRHERISTRLAPRAVLLTRQGSLFLLKNRGGPAGVIVERLEFGAYVSCAMRSRKKKKRMTDDEGRQMVASNTERRGKNGGSVERDPPPLRIDVTVDKGPFPHNLQAICIAGWTRSKLNGRAGRPNVTPSMNAGGAFTTEEAMWSNGVSTRQCNDLLPASSPSPHHAPPHEAKEGEEEEGLCAWRVLALRFCATRGLLASLLALKIKEIATTFGNSDVMTFNVSPQNASLHLARQHMALCASSSSSVLPRGVHEILWSVPQPLRHRSSAAGSVGRWGLSMLEPRTTVRDVVVKGLDEPAIFSRLRHDPTEARDSVRFSSSSSSESSSSSLSSLSSSKCTVDLEAERAEELAERRKAKLWQDAALSAVADDDEFTARLVEVLDDITSLSKLSRTTGVQRAA